MTDLIHEAEASFESAAGDGLIIKKQQFITDEMLQRIADKRNSLQSTLQKTGWFHEVAEIPTGVVEVWKSQGFDIHDRNIKARDIVARLRREGLEAFITTPKKV